MSPSQMLGSTLAEAKATAQAIKKKFRHKYDLAVVLGSGFTEASSVLQGQEILPYEGLPHLRSPSVLGHSGQFIVGKIASCTVLMLAGRFHLYEGYSPGQIAFLTLVCHELGVKNMLLTNAAGSLTKRISPGNLCLIYDHLNFPGFAGKSPLGAIGDFPHNKRFLDCSQLYTGPLFHQALAAAQSAKLKIKKGVYAYVAGPQYETPAEGTLFRNLGADLCGMSTVPEALIAHALGMEVCALSGVTNFISPPKKMASLKQQKADSEAGEKICHEDVIIMGRTLAEQFKRWFLAFCSAF